MKGENEAQNPETKGTAGQCTILRHVTQKRLRATPIGRAPEAGSSDMLRFIYSKSDTEKCLETFA